MPLPSSAVTDPCTPAAITRLEPINKVPRAIVVFLMIFRYMNCLLRNFGRCLTLSTTSSVLAACWKVAEACCLRPQINAKAMPCAKKCDDFFEAIFFALVSIRFYLCYKKSEMTRYCACSLLVSVNAMYRLRGQATAVSRRRQGLATCSITPSAHGLHAVCPGRVLHRREMSAVPDICTRTLLVAETAGQC